MSSIRNLDTHLSFMMNKFIDKSSFTKAWFSYAADAPATWPLVLPRILF